MNPNLVYSKWEKEHYDMDGYYNDMYQGNGNPSAPKKIKSKARIKKVTILPCIPSVTYTYKF